MIGVSLADPVKRLLYLVGIPGSGKTTLMAAALAGVPSLGEASKPFAHVVYPRGCQLGRLRSKFSGTDALSLSVQPRVLEWLAGPCPYINIVGEGDRLGNHSFFSGVQNLGWELTVVYLDTPESVALERCAARGSNQDKAWWRGRVTKVHNLVNAWPCLRMDGTNPLDVLASQLGTFPMIQALAGTHSKKA